MEFRDQIEIADGGVDLKDVGRTERRVAGAACATAQALAPAQYWYAGNWIRRFEGYGTLRTSPSTSAGVE
jgi:hypothetical protein